MSEQFEMKRQQKVAYTTEEAKDINDALDVMKACTGKDVTVNKFIRESTKQRANDVLEGDGNGKK